MRRLTLLFLVVYSGLAWGQSTKPSVTPPVLLNTDLTAPQLALLSAATAGDTCNASTHVRCAPNTGTEAANGNGLLAQIAASKVAIEAGSSTDGEVIVLTHNDGAANHGYFHAGGSAPFPAVSGDCIGNNIPGGLTATCGWYIGSLHQPDPAHIKPLFIVSDHYGHFPDQFHRAIPVTGDGMSSPAGQIANVSPSDYASIFNRNSDALMYIGQNDTNGIRFIGIEFTNFSTTKLNGVYEKGANYGGVRAVGAGTTGARAMEILDTNGNQMQLSPAIRIHLGYPTITAVNVVATTPCSSTYNVTVPASTPTLVCFTGLGTHWVAGRSYVRFVFNTKDVASTDITINALSAGGGSGQCAAGATQAGNDTIGNICVVDSTHAYTSVTGTPTVVGNGGVHSMYIETLPQYPLSAAANASGGNTTYTGTFNTSNIQVDQVYTVAGFSTGANNGTFSVVGVTASTLVLNNPSGASESHAATASGTGVFVAGTEHTASDEAIVLTQPQSWTMTCNDCPIPKGADGQIYIPTSSTAFSFTAQGTASGPNATNWTANHRIVLALGGGTVLKDCALSIPPRGTCVPYSFDVVTQTITQGFWAPGTNSSTTTSSLVTAGGFGRGVNSANENDVIYRNITDYTDNPGTALGGIDYCGPLSTGPFVDRLSRNYASPGDTVTLTCHGLNTHWNSSMNCSGTCGTSPINLGSNITVNSITDVDALTLHVSFTLAAEVESGARNIIFDRSWVHGDDGQFWDASVPSPTLTPCLQSNPNMASGRSSCFATNMQDIPNGFKIEGPNNAVINSYVNALHDGASTAEAQGIVMGVGIGPYKIKNNFVSAGTENVWTGGGTGWALSNSMDGLNDVEITNNYIYKPPIWYNWGIGSTGGGAYFTGTNCSASIVTPSGTHFPSVLSAKDGWETKGGNRTWIHENVFENQWVGCVNPYGVLNITGRNGNHQGTTGHSTNDLLIENNLITGIHQGYTITDYDANTGYGLATGPLQDPTVSNGAMPAIQARRVVIRNNLFLYDKSLTDTGAELLHSVGEKFGGDGEDSWWFDHNTALSETGVTMNTNGQSFGSLYFSFASATCAGGFVNNIWYTNNVEWIGQGANAGCGGEKLNTIPNSTGNTFSDRFAGNIFPKPGVGIYPANTYNALLPPGCSGASCIIPTVNNPKAKGWPQLDQSAPFNIDYTLTGPTPSLTNWIGPGAPNTVAGSGVAAGVTAGVNMAPIQAMAIHVMKGEPVGATVVNIQNISVPNAAQGEAYTFAFTATGGVLPYTWGSGNPNMTVCPTKTANLCIDSAAGTLAGTPTGSGVINFNLTVVDSSSPTPETDNQNLSLTINPALAVVTTSLPSGTVGGVYSASLTSSGGIGPFTWSISVGTLPAGLNLNTASGAITGTPTLAGTSAFTARVVDPGGASATKSLSITVTPHVTITTSSLPDGTQNVAYSQTIGASGGTTPYTWNLLTGSLCTGLNLTTNGSTPYNGIISGTPTVVQSCSFTVQATDALGATAQQPLTINILPAANPLVFNNVAEPCSGALCVTDGVVSIPYSVALSASGGTRPYLWSVSSGSLPPGLSISGSDASAFIAGIPLQIGTFNFGISVTDSAGSPQGATKLFTVIIAPLAGTNLGAAVQLNPKTRIK